MNYTKLLISMLLASIAVQPNQTYSMSRLFNLRNFALVGATAALGTLAYKTANNLYFNSIHWDWKNIDPIHITIDAAAAGLDIAGDTNMIISIAEFYKLHTQKLQAVQEDRNTSYNEFLWGTATSSYQVEGHCTNNQWNFFEGQMLDGEKVETAGIACDSWNHEDEDIAHMKELGVNTYRFSIEWSKVCPKSGVINKEVLNHYKQFCIKLVNNGIKPVITLYHYTEPQWFYYKRGFEYKENIEDFVFFCQKVFEELHEYVYAWFTFNAPEGIALGGWLAGVKPPAKKDMQLAVTVLRNILEAHVQVYKRIKSLPGGKESRIGILKNILQLDPWNIANPLDHLGCYIGNILQNDSIYNFFTTGIFKVYIPFKVDVYHSSPDAIHSLDFIGLNYYCHNYIKNFKTIREPNSKIEIPTNNKKYTIYAEGLHRAIEEISKRIAKPLGIPIYITENGIGTNSDEHRILHNQRSLYALARAIQDGHDVRGYIHWSLLDNFEWGKYSKFYGLYAVDRTTPNLTRSKKPSAWYFESVVKGLPPVQLAQ